MIALLLANAAEEGRNVILGMLVTGLVFVLVIAIGETSRALRHRGATARARLFDLAQEAAHDSEVALRLFEHRGVRANSKTTSRARGRPLTSMEAMDSVERSYRPRMTSAGRSSSWSRGRTSQPCNAPVSVHFVGPHTR